MTTPTSNNQSTPSCALEQPSFPTSSTFYAPLPLKRMKTESHNNPNSTTDLGRFIAAQSTAMNAARKTLLQTITTSATQSFMSGALKRQHSTISLDLNEHSSMLLKRGYTLTKWQYGSMTGTVMVCLSMEDRIYMSWSNAIRTLAEGTLDCGLRISLKSSTLHLNLSMDILSARTLEMIKTSYCTASGHQESFWVPARSTV